MALVYVQWNGDLWVLQLTSLIGIHYRIDTLSVSIL